MRKVDETNLDTEVILGREKVVRLRDLAPYSEWPAPLSERGGEP
jgi:hypothetical protein